MIIYAAAMNKLQLYRAKGNTKLCLQQLQIGLQLLLFTRTWLRYVRVVVIGLANPPVWRL